MPKPQSEWARYAIRAERGVELLHAHYARHVYGRHSHEAYAIGVTLDGVQAFTCRGAVHASTAGRIMAFNADDPHDGWSGSPEGFTYRMLYVTPAAVRRVIADALERPAALPFFAEPVIDDERLAQGLALAHQALAEDAPALEQDQRIEAAILALVRRHGTRPIRPPAHDGDERAAARARDYLHAHYAQNVAAAELAHVAGLSRFRLSRLFRRIYRLPPHDYQMQLRMAEAKRLLGLGEKPAEVAAAIGLVDQSHLNKRFRRAFGITPGAFRQAARRARS